jgi:hypothetical protein
LTWDLDIIMSYCSMSSAHFFSVSILANSATCRARAGQASYKVSAVGLKSLQQLETYMYGQSNNNSTFKVSAWSEHSTTCKLRTRLGFGLARKSTASPAAARE